MVDSNPKIAGERIKDARLHAGLTMEEFIERIDGKSGKGRSGTVNNWENGKNLPNKRRLKAIADLDGVTIDYLQGISNDSVPNDETIVEISKYIKSVIKDPKAFDEQDWLTLRYFLEVLLSLNSFSNAGSLLFDITSNLDALTDLEHLDDGEKVNQDRLLDNFKKLLTVINKVRDSQDK